MRTKDASGTGSEGREPASWANESLPMSVRRELLERELVQLGFRRRDAVSARQQEQQASGEGHPRAASPS